jgi:ribonuclease HI
VMQRVVALRWGAANAAARTDGGDAIERFKRKWVAPGLAAIHDGRVIALVLATAQTRSRWRRPAATAQAFRKQQYAPPSVMPPHTIQIYVQGEAKARKMQPGGHMPPAGYGLVMTTDGRPICEVGRHVGARTPHVRTTTTNVALLAAVEHALRWAETHPLARGRPVCIRYNEEYAVRVGTGAWRAKKHKPLAAATRLAWRRLQKQKAGHVWIKHAPLSDKHLIQATKIAQAAMNGSEREHRV